MTCPHDPTGNLLPGECLRCLEKKPKERTLWPEEERNPNETDQLVIVLPFAMPTWNRILALQVFQRMRLRHLVHAFVFNSITSGEDWPTQMVCQSKQQSTLLLRLEYLAVTRPRKSRKSVISKLKLDAKKKKKPS